LELVAARPWLGWGAAAFSVLYPIYAAKRWHGHSHNLPLELAISHGLPVMLLIVGTVLLLLVVALRKGILQKAPMERAWWTATLVLVAMHATDLPFFDSRLNILGWTLLAGLAAFNQEVAQTPDPRPDRDGPAASSELGGP
jgi:O-antigen ligase